MNRGTARPYPALVSTLFLIPAVHPLLIPLVGVPSHLLWFIHVLPVALLTYWFGRQAVAPAVGVSVVLVMLGEKTFGAGYGEPADWETAVALSVAVLFTTALVASFALYARGVTHRYRLLFEGLTLGVLRTDPDGTIRAANPAAMEILGVDGDAVQDRKLQEILVSPELDDLAHLARSGGWTGRVEVRIGDTPRSLHILLVVIPLPGRKECQILLSDRSVQVLQEQELQRRAKLASLGEALAGVAHELNNPLTAILGHARLGSADDALPEERREALMVVQEQGRRMQALIGELLGFSRSHQSDETRIHSLLRRIIRIQQIALPGSVRLREEIEWEGTVCAPPDKVEQIVLNLVSNASDVMRDREEGEIVLACRARNPWLEIEVRDDGPGVPEEILDRIFQPFVTTKPEGEGTGLGLAISRRLARTLEGELEAENRPGSGASFTLRLPLEECDEAGSREPATKAGPGEPVPGR